MKKVLLIIAVLGSMNTFADTITLKGGESIYMNGTVVKCEGRATPPASGNAQYADLAWGKLKTLLESGLGTCKIRYTQGSNPSAFYYSNRFNGLHVNNDSIGYIRDDIRQGNCD